MNINNWFSLTFILFAMYLNENKLGYMFVVIVALALIALLVLACVFYTPTQMEGRRTPSYKSLMIQP